MFASFNELKSLFKQAYQGAGLATGLYEYAAQNVVWTEAIGQNGLALFESQLMESRALTADNPIVTQEPNSPFDLNLDLGESSLAITAGLMSNLVVAQAVDAGAVACLVRTLSPKAYILWELTKLGRFNLFGLAAWQSGVEQVTIAFSSGIAPSVTINQYTGRLLVGDDLILVYAQDQHGLQELARQHQLPLNQAPLSVVSEYDLHSNYQSNLQSGIELSAQLWERLTDLAARSLVESTELSRRGAGA